MNLLMYTCFCINLCDLFGLLKDRSLVCWRVFFVFLKMNSFSITMSLFHIGLWGIYLIFVFIHTLFLKYISSIVFLMIRQFQKTFYHNIFRQIRFHHIYCNLIINNNTLNSNSTNEVMSFYNSHL